VTRISQWAVPALAALIAIFTLVPAEVWVHPAVDQEYKGFDPNLYKTTNGPSDSVTAAPEQVDLYGSASGHPAINLLTTPLRRIEASVTADIVRNEGAAAPLRVGLWSPLTKAGYFVVFGPAPTNAITVQQIVQGVPGATLLGGDIRNQVRLGTYATGNPYAVAIAADRDAGVISLGVAANGVFIGRDTITPGDFGAIFAPVRLSLTAESTEAGGSSHVVLGAYDLKLLHERFWTSKVTDAKALITEVAITILALLCLSVGIRLQRRRISDGFRHARAASTRLGTSVTNHRLALGAAIAAVLLYLGGNVFLFRFGGHPFDMGGAKVYAYVGQAYGPVQLYYLPNVVSLGPVWQGTPWSEAGFPYGPVMAYLYSAVGWIYRSTGPGSGFSVFTGLPLEAAIKTMDVLFGLADTALIYLILRRIAVPRPWRLAATALFLFNPAVWFSMSVWGQTHVISAFFALAAILFAEYGFAMLAWLALIAGCLTRPQMLVFALLIGVVLLRKFPWRTTVTALSWAIVVTFLTLVPLSLASSPSLPVDLAVNNFYVQEAGGNDRSLTTLSQGAYTVWPLISYLAHGYSGLGRIFGQSSGALVGSLSYQRASQIVTVVALILVLAALIRARRKLFESGEYIPLVALGVTAFLMLLTGIVATHFILALPLLILSWRWTGGVAYLYIVIAWSITTFVTLYGDMGLGLSSRDYPLLAEATNSVTRFFVWLNSNDRFVTVGTVANVCAVVWLAVLALGIPAMRPRSGGGQV